MKKFDQYLFVVLVLSLAIHYSGLVKNIVGEWPLFIISIIAIIPVFVSAFSSLRQKKVSVDLLASVALVVSLITREWESAVFINLMLTSARLFGYYTAGKSRAAIQSLLKLRPERVKIKRDDGRIEDVPIERVHVGDLVVIESGTRIAVDGIVEEGEASIDQSSLTGESVPVTKEKGNEVYSATLAVSGSLVIRAVKIGKDTTLEKIITLVEGSQNEKTSIKTTADTFAKWYIGIILVATILIYAFSHDLKLLLSLLLVACADDIAVAVPMAFLAATGYAAHRGVIIKGAAYLEGLTKIKTFVFDKTGTITSGKFAIQNIQTFNGFSEHDLLSYAAISQSVSNHPISKSIMRFIKSKNISFSEPDEFKEVPGKGIEATCKGKKVISGREIFLEDHSLYLSGEERKLVSESKNKGDTVTLIGYDGRVVGFIASADEVRPHAKPVIQRLKKLGVENIVMLTGDNELVAKKIADEIGVTHFHASLLPDEKLTHLKEFRANGGKIAMVGDGVNDAAALALADVGIAMGAIGSDAAIEAADIALMKDNLNEIPETIELGNYTRKIAKQDFIIWGVTNIVGLFLVFSGVIGPEGAAVFNFVTDFFPLLNSSRLFSLHLKLKKVLVNHNGVI